ESGRPFDRWHAGCFEPPLMRSLHLSVFLSVFTVALIGCEAEPEETAGPFVPSPDDEAIDLADPPTDPDPADPSALVPEAQACPQRNNLSPKGLTFVIHVSKDADNAQRALDHLRALRHYIRARDVFMVEHRAPVIDQLHDLFPCNRFHYIAYPA